MQLVTNIWGRTLTIKGSMIQISLLEMFKEKRRQPKPCLRCVSLHSASCYLIVGDEIDFAIFKSLI